MCRDIVIRNNLFKCAGFPAVGHHGDCGHHNILISGNIFDGPSGLWGNSRGYVIFRPMVYDVKVSDNVFLCPDESDSPNYGILFENTDGGKLDVSGNAFCGKIDKEIIIG